MNAYLVTITYTVDGTPRTHKPRSITASSAAEAKTIALGNFAENRDGKRVIITGASVR
jgi:hypothetical protein